MHVSEEQKSYEDIKIRIKRHEAADIRREVNTERMRYSETHIKIGELDGAARYFDDIADDILNNMVERYGKFSKAGINDMNIISGYGPNELVIQYMHQSIIGPERAEVAEANTESGLRALELIEHCMNEFTIIRGHIEISSIPFDVMEAESGGNRCAGLGATVTGPYWSERCIIFVGERDDKD